MSPHLAVITLDADSCYYSFINCIYLTSKIPPFIDAESLSSPNRKLSVVCDVVCPFSFQHLLVLEANVQTLEL